MPGKEGSTFPDVESMLSLLDHADDIGKSLRVFSKQFPIYDVEAIASQTNLNPLTQPQETFQEFFKTIDVVLQRAPAEKSSISTWTDVIGIKRKKLTDLLDNSAQIANHVATALLLAYAEKFQSDGLASQDLTANVSEYQTTYSEENKNWRLYMAQRGDNSSPWPTFLNKYREAKEKRMGLTKSIFRDTLPFLPEELKMSIEKYSLPTSSD